MSCYLTIYSLHGVILNPTLNCSFTVLHYLNNLQSTGLFTDPAFIPSNEVFLRIGGDRGGGSFKMSFQIANTDHPNKVENTVLFSVDGSKRFESKFTVMLAAV